MDMAVVGKCVSSIRGSASISCLTGKPNLPRRGGSGLMPSPGLQIIVQSPMTLTFEFLTQFSKLIFSCSWPMDHLCQFVAKSASEISCSQV